MNCDVIYPRVLFVHSKKIKSEDSFNLLIRMQFDGWPKESMAQIHATAEPEGKGEFCSKYYQLKSCDRTFGAFFFKVRGRVFNLASINNIKEKNSIKTSGTVTRLVTMIKKKLGDCLIESGLWEVIFYVRISQSMSRFIEDYKPQLIYCQGSLLGFVILPMLIADKYKIPICIQIVDDWPHARYRNSPVSFLIRHKAKALINRSKIRLAFGEKMQKEYENRYGVKFDITHHLDNQDRFKINVENTKKTYKIVYTGSLSLRRYEAIQDLLSAIRQMGDLSVIIEIHIYSPGIPKDMPIELLQSSEVKFYPLPSHVQLPSVLSEATLLFLPESFSHNRQMIEYSVSTKAHLYMMSNRTILVYGPSYSGTVDYAIREGWAMVVSERNVVLLKEVVKEIIIGSERVKKIIDKANVCIQRNHSISTGKQKFRKYLEKAI
jgi:glycosyltransferase involved in cell wall biosynthesis